jgi:hypothetical protein
MLALIAALDGLCSALFNASDPPPSKPVALYCGGLFICCLVSRAATGARATRSARESRALSRARNRLPGRESFHLQSSIPYPLWLWPCRAALTAV